MEDFINLIDEFRVSVFNLNVSIGVLAGITVFILEIFWIRRYEKKNRRSERKKQKGHIVTGKRISMWDDGEPGDSVNSYYHAKYRYEVNGKVYNYRYIGKTFPPLTISLYYKNSPKHVWSDFNKKQSPFAIFLYVIPVIITIAVIYVLGGI